MEAVGLIFRPVDRLECVKVALGEGEEVESKYGQRVGEHPEFGLSMAK